MRNLKGSIASFLAFAVIVGALGGAVSAVSAVSAYAADRPIREIKIAGGRVGDPWYILSEGLANFINKDSKWLRATVVPTPGITGDFELMKAHPKDYIIMAEMSNFVYMPRAPYGKPYGYYNKTRFISIGTSLTTVWITYDKNIKSLKDFAGKTVALSRRAAARNIDDKEILAEAGVLNKVKLAESGFGGMARNLQDGLADVSCMIVDQIYPFDFQKGSFITQLETKGPIYYVSTPPSIINDMRKKGYAPISVKIPAKSLDPVTQPDTIYGWALPMFFAADERMDNDVVYEVTRVIWENAGKFGKWLPQGKHMTKKFIPAMPMAKKFVHPGAKKFYDEHGIKLVDLADLLK